MFFSEQSFAGVNEMGSSPINPGMQENIII